jgi:hypothetical protein
MGGQGIATIKLLVCRRKSRVAVQALRLELLAEAYKDNALLIVSTNILQPLGMTMRHKKKSERQMLPVSSIF